MSNKTHITQRLARALRYTKTLSHFKHYHGYGVHSPFAYSLVRNVFMQHTITGDDKALFDALVGAGVGRRRAVQIQNLYTFCHYNHFSIDNLDSIEPTELSLVIATTRSKVESIAGYAARVGEVQHNTLCVIYPRNNRPLSHCCSQLVKRHNGMSVDNIGFLLLFYNNLKPKQHLKL